MQNVYKIYRRIATTSLMVFLFSKSSDHPMLVNHKYETFIACLVGYQSSKINYFN